MVKINHSQNETIMRFCIIALLILSAVLNVLAVTWWGMHPLWLLLTITLSLVSSLLLASLLVVPAKPLFAYSVARYGYAPARRVLRAGTKDPDADIREMAVRLRWMRAKADVDTTPIQKAIAAVGPEGFRQMIHLLAEDYRTKGKKSSRIKFSYEDVQDQLYVQEDAVIPVLMEEVESDDALIRELAEQLLESTGDAPLD